MTPALIIFDCDGVLVDTEHITGAFLRRYLLAHGGEDPQGDALLRYRGSSLAAAITDLEERTGTRVPDDFAARFRSETMATMATEVKAIPGVADVLERITTRKCVASNGPRQKMQLTLRVTRLSHHFGDAVFSAYDIQKWKPDPALFLHAARALGIPPEHCLVVEDSLHGVEAAVAAGMPVLGFGPAAEAAGFRNAGAHSFSDMASLPDLIMAL